ncbi:MAG: transglycosylase SLT domain-containing protein [Acidocella sp.]|nr:transglycosylase SLT domain-containing protein [Acidocella sp.]
MTRLLIIFGPPFWVLWILGLATPAAASVPIAAPASSCAAAGNAAETAATLPANILVSIGMVESGRVDALTGHVAPWPWTVNIDGAGHYFASKQDAIAFTRLAQSSGANDIDVGCFQVSLKYHPDAFPDLDTAFDPAANATYAAGYLSQLKAQTGSWNTAIADYHSAVPDLGLPYQRRVLAAWHGIGNIPSAINDINIDAPDPVVIMQAPAARLVRVITMESLAAEQSRPGMPRVITP